MDITGNEEGHKNDDKKTIDLSAELKATTSRRRRQKVSKGPGEPRARRQAPSGNRRSVQTYSDEMKQECLPNNTKTPIRRVPISRIKQRRRTGRIPRPSAENTIRIPDTRIKLSNLNSFRSSSESDKAEQKTLARPTDQLEPGIGLNQPSGNNRQIDNDYEFAMQLQMSDRGKEQSRRNAPVNHSQPSTSVNVQFYSDNGRGQNNRMSMHHRNADDGTSTTIRVNQGNSRANLEPIVSIPPRQSQSQIERDAELARRIMESDFQDSEDDQDSPLLRPVDSPVNTNHRFASDEALARRIQEELYKEQGPIRSLPVFPPRRFHMEEDDGFFSDYSDGYVSSFLPDHSAGWRRVRPVNGGIFDADVDALDHDELLELGERIGHVSRGAKQSTINELPTRKFVQKSKPVDEKTADADSKESEADIMSCCICMIAFKTSEDVRTLPCLHIYHTKCIDKWLLRNRTCPICKFDITQNSLA